MFKLVFVEFNCVIFSSSIRKYTLISNEVSDIET